MNAVVPNTTIVRLPLKALYLSESNVRGKKKHSPESIRSLAECIAHMGQLQNLVVKPDDASMTRAGVIAGGRRLAAFELLLSDGRITDEHEVDCKITFDDVDAVSLAENVQREQMHPADEFDSIRAMYEDKGYSIDRIADLLAITPLVVERRLQLTKAHPELLADFRAEKLTTDQLIALCATPDQDRQLEVWKECRNYYNPTPNMLRKRVLESTIDCSTDARIRLIGGIDAFTAAGGAVERDLFSDAANAGISRDVGLLDKLVNEKLQEVAGQVKAEGWAWVEVLPDGPNSNYYRFGTIHAVDHEPTGELAEQLAALQAQDDALYARQREIEIEEDAENFEIEDNEEYDTIMERREELGAQLGALRQSAPGAFTDEQRASAGVVIYPNNGAIEVIRGKVKGANRSAAAAASGSAVEGGRETNAAGRKDNAISDTLRRSLLGRRNRYVQQEVAKNARVAKVLLAQRMAGMLKSAHTLGGTNNEGRGVCDLSLSDFTDGARLHHSIVGGDSEVMSALLWNVIEPLIKGMPNKHVEQWDYFAGKSDSELDAIIAVGVGMSVSVNAEHKGLTAKLLDALNFNLSDHMEANADNYFGRIPKGIILDSLKDAGKCEDRAALETMKKGDLASAAEKRIASTGWLPKLIRTPAPKAPKKSTAPAPNTGATTPATATAGKKTADKKPAGKAHKAANAKAKKA
ncbi:hypothetical protein LMG31884_47330 (plasmid) [Xanthomonas hydrangeae]|uniref:ParB/RepB/Spo0J family partition protein n=1 Tax=Xanthomonas hydrangeae TaxID=2775159 RepID=UPI00196399D7|nr:hypothetical protein LMG31884_47330 [Xanthomonas hydrangeae]CAD7741143.1 hypothetical protein LMG31884_47330 [Xanthomonas hydrangeae]